MQESSSPKSAACTQLASEKDTRKRSHAEACSEPDDEEQRARNTDAAADTLIPRSPGRGLAPVDFLIVGAQKAGTMAAVKNLNK